MAAVIVGRGGGGGGGVAVTYTDLLMSGSLHFIRFCKEKFKLMF